MKKRAWPTPKDPGFPCPHCGVRPDVACARRPADPYWSMGPEPPDEDGRRKATARPGNGNNFHRRRSDLAGRLKP